MPSFFQQWDTISCCCNETSVAALNQSSTQRPIFVFITKNLVMKALSGKAYIAAI